MKFLKQNSVNLLISLCELIIGILLLIDPTGFSNGIIIAFGAACLAFGVVQIVFYWKKPLAEAISRFYLMKGLISISVGLFCICFSHWFLETFKLLSFLYGILLLISGFYKVQWSIDLLRQKRKALVACRSKCRTVHSVFSYYRRKPIFNCYCHMDFFWCCANCRSNY